MTQKKLHPRQDFERKEWKNLNGQWDFSFDGKKYGRKITVPFPWGSPLSGVGEKQETKGYYRKNVKWAPKGERIFLVFGAVDYKCTVKINGQKAGSHTGGYAQFEFDVTDFWKRDSSNLIEVIAEDKAKLTQTYGKQGYGNAKGIWQTVFLEARPSSFVKWFRVTTLCSGEITFDIETSDCPDGTPVNLSFEGGKASGTVTGCKASVTFNIPNPRLWSCEDPFLYFGKIVFGDGSVPQDVVYTYFGIREVGTGHFGKRGVNYITLNGKPVFISGFLDQSFNPKGFFTLPSDKDCEDEIMRAKNAGMNCIRIHIKADEPLKLFYADKCGVLVMEDIPCFWSEPYPAVKKQFEKEMFEQLRRDVNHPAVFYYVIFNETWGLFSKVTDETGSKISTYTDETAAWVADCFRKVKAFDRTRLVEDNSVCHCDHTITDVNTWHFYTNGYSNVKKTVEDFCSDNVPGSSANYSHGFVMEDVPLMNSECGNYWGIAGNAGESDISWQFKYMINEFRRNEKLCGYIFTEFHDVTNEFNGFYKLNNDKKLFGYESFGTSVALLNSQDYTGADFAPSSVFTEGSKISVPLFVSSFTDENHGSTMKISWSLYAEDRGDGRKTFCSGEAGVVYTDYGVTDVCSISFKAPAYDGPAILSWKLINCESGKKVCSNFISFDFRTSEDNSGYLVLNPLDLTYDSWNQIVRCELPSKISGLGSGSFSVSFDPDNIPGVWENPFVRLTFEASTRFPMAHDFTDKAQVLGDLMLGYEVDPGDNFNSFPQTDGATYMGTVKITLGDSFKAYCKLPDCPADSQGILSHTYQQADNKLLEAGSYGFLCSCMIPSEIFFEDILGKPVIKEEITLTFSTDNGCGLSLFGRYGGRYGLGIRMKGVENRE